MKKKNVVAVTVSALVLLAALAYMIMFFSFMCRPANNPVPINPVIKFGTSIDGGEIRIPHESQVTIECR